MKSPPLLAWRPVAGLSCYNVQLYYGVGATMRRLASVGVSGRKVLSVWPLQSRYRLKKAWKYKGKTRKLAPGHYRWYVYPGVGKRTANKYGPLIGAERLLHREALAGQFASTGPGAVLDRLCLRCHRRQVQQPARTSHATRQRITQPH